MKSLAALLLALVCFAAGTVAGTWRSRIPAIRPIDPGIHETVAVVIDAAVACEPTEDRKVALATCLAHTGLP